MIPITLTLATVALALLSTANKVMAAPTDIMLVPLSTQHAALQVSPSTPTASTTLVVDTATKFQITLTALRQDVSWRLIAPDGGTALGDYSAWYYLLAPGVALVDHISTTDAVNTALDDVYAITGGFSGFQVVEVKIANQPSAFVRGRHQWVGLQENDIVVTRESSTGLNTPFVSILCDGNRKYYLGSNGHDHSALLNAITAMDDVLPRAKDADSLFGGMKPW